MSLNVNKNFKEKKIRYVRTGIFLNQERKRCGFKNTRIKCGRGLMVIASVSTPISIYWVKNAIVFYREVKLKRRKTRQIKFTINNEQNIVFINVLFLVLRLLHFLLPLCCVKLRLGNFIKIAGLLLCKLAETLPATIGRLAAVLLLSRNITLASSRFSCQPRSQGLSSYRLGR